MSSSAGTGLGGDAPVVLFSFVPGLDPQDLSSSPANFIRMIRAINASTDGTLFKGEQLKQKVADLFPPARMFNHDMMEVSLLHQELVDWLNHWEVGIITDRSTRTMMTLAAQLYQDDDRVLAIKMVDEYTHQGGSSPVVKQAHTTPTCLAQMRDVSADGSLDRREDGPSSADAPWLPRFPLLPSQDARNYPGSAPRGRRDDVPIGGTAFREGNDGGSRHRAIHSGVGNRSRTDEASGRDVAGSRTVHDAGGRGGGDCEGASDAFLRASGSHRGASGETVGLARDDDYGRGHGAGRSYANDGHLTAVPVDRQAHNIGQRFKDVSAKFSGKGDQLWDDYVLQYDLVTHDYRVDAGNKLAFLHNILAGEALRFFLDHVIGFAATYADACSRVRSRFLSPVDQERAKNDLQRLRMSDFVAKGMSEKAALDETFKVVERMSKKVPKGFDSDQHRANLLRSAVLGPQWAKQPLSGLGAGAVGFQDLYRQLQAALALDNDSDAAALRDRASARDGGVAAAGVFYNGQGRYGVANTGVGNRAPFRPGGDRKMTGSARTGGCWNCGDASHRLADCTSGRIDWEKVRKSRSKFWAERRPSKDVAATVYHEICCELAGTSMLSSNKMCDPDDGKAEDAGQDNAGVAEDQDGHHGRVTDGGTHEAASELFYAMTGIADDAVAGRRESGPGF